MGMGIRLKLGNENGKEQVRVQLATSAANMTLPAFAAERDLLLSAGACCTARRQQATAVHQSIDISCSTGTQQQSRRCCARSTGQTHRRTDGRSTV